MLSSLGLLRSVPSPRKEFEQIDNIVRGEGIDRGKPKELLLGQNPNY
jgi:hypothetical protein